ncbi:galactosyltransferase-related protein [Candidatus Pacearchaeota archaeon]|jgi:predicted glycosyltransferase involved in capsule biosynthesis|nr:galactosyltransferase-related protein [Candidatus Pacearchaeota archaeon]
MFNIVGISTCKGRLNHIQRTATAFIESTPNDVGYLVVDYECPEHTGEWVRKNLDPSRAEALVMRAKPGVFHKTIALNAGSKYAISKMCAEYLLYFDADTIIRPGFINQISPLLRKDRFIIAEPTGEEDLTGLLVIHKSIFTVSGGFEESFRSWGAEDLEFRLRLFAKHHCQFDVISCENLVPIHHDNNLRVKFYTDKDIDFSNKRNFHRLLQMYQAYTGNSLTLKGLNDSKLPDKDALFKLLSLHPRIASKDIE